MLNTYDTFVWLWGIGILVPYKVPVILCHNLQCQAHLILRSSHLQHDNKAASYANILSLWVQKDADLGATLVMAAEATLNKRWGLYEN